MTPRIAVYRAEVEGGIADEVIARASLAYASLITPLSPEDDLCTRLASAAANLSDHNTDSTLFYMKDVLVSTGWNNNDDIFLNEEVWAARHTPVDKPINFGHDQLDIIGHTIASAVVDDSLKVVPPDSLLDDLPPRYHVLNGTVIYRGIGGQDRIDQIEKTIAEIKSGEWFVSMECLMPKFDYGVIGPDGSHRVIARAEDTAWLTKYLRIYRPKNYIAKASDDPRFFSGTYVDKVTSQEFKIGRVLRNFTFCGKGLVRKPANPDSVILTSTASFVATAGSLGYITPTIPPPTPEPLPMPDDTPEVKALQETIAELRAEISTQKNKGFESQIATLTADNTAKASQVTDLTAKVALLTATATQAETAVASLTSELSTIKSAETKRVRLAALISKGATETVADKLVGSFASLDDTSFASVIDGLSTAWVKPVVDPPPLSSKAETEIKAIDTAKVEPDASLTVPNPSRETAIAELAMFFESNLLHTTRDRTNA